MRFSVFKFCGKAKDLKKELFRNKFYNNRYFGDKGIESGPRIWPLAEQIRPVNRSTGINSHSFLRTASKGPTYEGEI